MPFPVKLQVYDVSRGIARTLSVSLLGKYVDGLWHTGINVFGHEYYYGGNGIAYCAPGSTVLGHPTEIVDLGETEITQDVFHDYLANLSQTLFSPESYHVVDHNCNSFSNEMAQFLTGRTIPSKIVSLSADIMSTPFGKLVRPMIEKMQGAVNSGTFIGHHRGETSDKKDSDPSSSKTNPKPEDTTSRSTVDSSGGGATSSAKTEENKMNKHKDMELD